MYVKQPETITYDGKELNVSELNQLCQTLVAIHTKWRNELIDARLEVDKSNAAIRAAEIQLSEAIAAFLNPPEASGETTPE